MAELLKPKKIVVRHFRNLTWAQAMKVARAHKSKKYGILEAAYEVVPAYKVEPSVDSKYNVRMEYIAKD
jgi:hypothetical protein